MHLSKIFLLIHQRRGGGLGFVKCPNFSGWGGAIFHILTKAKYYLFH